MKKLTEVEIEQAARLSCKSQGIDPDEMVYIENGGGFMQELWRVEAEEIKKLQARMQAMVTVIENLDV